MQKKVVMRLDLPIIHINTPKKIAENQEKIEQIRSAFYLWSLPPEAPDLLRKRAGGSGITEQSREAVGKMKENDVLFLVF
ncbi:MAG: hypothetical protein WHS82_00615 [Candidatus Methanosuratincola sp.]